MSREISIFSDYHQRENSLTNYCGLMMKTIYENSPKNFEEILTTILPNEINLIVGTRFQQQTKQRKSIPDLAITQRSFSIFFETKLSDWFYEEQIRRHITSFDNKSEIKILILLSNFEDQNIEIRFHEAIQSAKSENIIIQPLSFEDFVGALEGACNTLDLQNLLDEFKTYLERNDLLPKWKYLLDVVNCTGTYEEIDENVYMCPDTGGAYSHRRAKYFGPYLNKSINQIFEIKALVVIEKEISDGRIKWKNVNVEDEILIIEAKNMIRKWDWRVEENKTVDLQVFLLEKPFETSFFKISSGGMQQSKRYFWDIAIDCKNSQELAAKLKNEKWR